MLLILSITLFSCAAKKAKHNIGENYDLTSNPDVAKSALSFARNVLKDNLRIRFHERARSNYLDVQMIFETDNFETDHFISYSSYSNQLYKDNSTQGNYDGFLLFVATYDNTKSAEYAFQEIKSNSQIRIIELEGFAGLFVEQVQVFEKIRKSGGMIIQKDNYVFYLVETCGEPPIEDNWSDFENLFLQSITENNEEIEVLNADCEKEVFLIQKIKADR